MLSLLRLRDDVVDRLRELVLSGECDSFKRLVEDIAARYREIAKYFRVSSFSDVINLDAPIETLQRARPCFDRYFVDIVVRVLPSACWSCTDFEPDMPSWCDEYNMVIAGSSPHDLERVLRKVAELDRICWVFSTKPLPVEKFLNDRFSEEDCDVVVPLSKPALLSVDARAEFVGVKRTGDVEIMAIAPLKASGDDIVEEVRKIWSMANSLNPRLRIVFEADV